MSRRPDAPRHATELDREGLVALFDHLAGRTLLGAVDCGDYVELGFTLDGDGTGANLVTIQPGARMGPSGRCRSTGRLRASSERRRRVSAVPSPAERLANPDPF